MFTRITTYAPDQLTNITFSPGQGVTALQLIPCKHIASDTTVNQYNCNLVALPLPFAGAGTIRIGLYRNTKSIFTAAAGDVVATLVPGTSFAVSVTFPVPATVNGAAFGPVTIAGGDYWVGVMFDDTSPGGSSCNFTADGILIVDANCVGQKYLTLPASGSLPASLTKSQLTNSGDVPWVEVNYA